jgi:hypothetical protein
MSELKFSRRAVVLGAAGLPAAAPLVAAGPKNIVVSSANGLRACY